VRAGFSVLVAWLSYRFVEQPFMRRRKHPVLVPVPAIASSASDPSGSYAKR